MKKKLLIIKLGGSVVTYKSSLKPKARLKIIYRLGAEIKQILKTKKYKLILVHGAGSFAHPLVKKHKLHLGMSTEAQKLAFSQVRLQLLQLNSIIIKALFKNKIPATSLPPHSFITQSSGKFNGFDYGVVVKLLNQRQIPVLFGDIVLDDKWGSSVISGDTIVPYLAMKLKADKVIFLSDVDGIYTADPKKNSKAKLIPEINSSNYYQVSRNLSPNNIHDVTGEMRGKILELKRHLNGVEIRLMNGLRSGNLLKSLDQYQLGTKLLFD